MQKNLDKNNNMRLLRILKKALDNMSIGITISDRKRKIIYTNPTDASIHGYSVKELLGKDARVFAPSELWNPLPIEKVTSTKQWKRESLNKRKDGQLFPVLLSSDIVTDKKGQPAIIMTACEDISAHKQTTKELQESNQNHKDLLALHSFVNRISTSLKVDEVIIRSLQEIARVITPDISFFYMREGDKLRLIDILPKGQGPILPETKEVGNCLCGLAAREGKPFYSNDIHTDLLCTLNECKQAGLHSFAALPLCGREGVLGVLSLASFKERDFSKQRAFLEILVSHITIALQNAFLCQQIQNHTEQLENEITARKSAEEALKKESFFRATIIDNGAEGICTCHTIPEYPYFRFTVWNNRMKAITGYTMDEINRRGWYQTVYPDPEIQAKALERMSNMRHGDNLLREEWEITRADEEKRTLSISTTIIQVEDGSVHVLAFMEDITDRKQTEAKLLEREEKMQSIFRVAPTGIGVVKDRILLDVNLRVCEMTGYSKEELVGKSARIFYLTQEDFEYVGTEKYRQISEKGTGVVETRWMKKDGTTIDVILASTPIDLEDMSKGVTFTALDITERKKAEAALHESEIFLRTVIDLVPHFIFVKDDQSRFLLVNKALAEAYGTTTHDIIGKSDIDFSATPEEAEHFHKNDLEVIRSGIPKIIPEEIITDSKGKQRYLQTVKIPFRFGIDGTPCIVGVAIDITENKRAGEALYISEEKYRLVVENASDAIFILQDEMIQFPNRQSIAILGYTEKELTGVHFSHFLHADDKDMVMDRIHRGLRGEDVPSVYSFRIINKTWEIIWVEISAVLLTWEERPAALNFLRDITGQKKLEAQLLHAQKMEAVGQLAGGVAHDFNNLLTAIIGYGHLLKKEVSQDDRTSSYIGHILSAAERAAILTNDLLTFSRKQIINPQPVNLNKIIKNVESLLLMIIVKDIELSTVLTDTDLTIMADSTQIDQILMNLTTNAQDAMPNGGSLIIRTGRVELNGEYIKAHGYGKSGSYALLSIEDTGVGIEEMVRERIFEPFFTTKEVGKGTGLGLSMVYGIIKQHDGYINVYSEPGRGTTFKILLPLI